MEQVARYLQIEAMNRSTEDEREEFGRSSYNRYYYATFLIVRSKLRELNSDWGTMAHSSYPELLAGTIRREFDKSRYQANKIRDHELVELLNKARSATHQLAELMKLSYAVRVTADYFPEKKLEFSQEFRFRLGPVKITDAHEWPSRARTLALSIFNAWKQINDP